MKNNSFCSCKYFFGFLVVSLFFGGTILEAFPQRIRPPVTLQGKVLWVNGKRFVIKGVCYNPTRIGEMFPSGSQLLYPTQRDLFQINRDFFLMKQAGINTIRTYVAVTDPYILGLINYYHLHVIVPIYPSYQVNFLEVKKTVNILKNNPSTLLWEVGNEWNYNHLYSQDFNNPSDITNDIGLDAVIEKLKEAIDVVRVADEKHHPISTSIGELPCNPYQELNQPEMVQQQAAAIRDLPVDLYSSNVYDWLSFGKRFAQWAAFTNKPIYFGEFGADAWNEDTHSYDDKDQAFALDKLLTEIEAHIPSRWFSRRESILLGGCLFEWCDEWWKSPGEPLDQHSTKGIYNPFFKPVRGPYPDHCFNEEWFGIVDIERHPRPAYDVVRNHYKKSS
jgi:hypothetical protein